MNRRPSLLAAAALTCAPGFAQTPQVDEATPVTGPVKYAGRFDASTETWERGASIASRAGVGEVIYSNTAMTGYFYQSIGPTGPVAFGTVVDEGAIPSTSHPGPFATGVTRDASVVETVTIGYCDLDPNPAVAGFTLEFYSSYDPCTYPPDPTQLEGIVQVSGLPSNGCWVLDVTGLSFNMQHDGDGFYDGLPALDSFGVSWSYTGTGSAAAGLMIAGDPANTDSGWVLGATPSTGSNTYYGEVGGCPGFGTGFGNDDFYWVEDVFGSCALCSSGCYFFGGYDNGGATCGNNPTVPYGGFHVELAAQLPPPPPCFCIPGCIGSFNSTGVPGGITATGSPVAADNDVALRAFDLPPNQFGIFATGLEPIPPGVINSGNGTLCINPTANGGLGRFAGPAQIKSTGPLGEFVLDTNAGEWSLGMIPTSLGTYAAAAGVTSYFQAWHREPAGLGWNFTSSMSISWQ